MPLDPQVAELLTQMDAPPMSSLTVAEARQQMINSSQLLVEAPEIAEVIDDRASGPAGDIPIRIYRAEKTDRPLPALVYFHGGGWVIGSIETHDVYCRQLAAESGLCVISVDYRLAPEHPYPAAAEDCFAATKWIAQHADRLQIDASHIAVGGDSAGGNLATVVAMMSRDRGGPPLRFQLLIYPITDFDFDTASYHENADGYHLTRDAMIWFANHYVPDHGQRDQPYAAPLRAEDLSQLPPALVITAQYDPLRDEGEAYARRLEQAGVDVQLLRYGGMIHGFVRRTQFLDAAQQCLTDVATALKLAMGVAER